MEKLLILKKSSKFRLNIIKIHKIVINDNLLINVKLKIIFIAS